MMLKARSIVVQPISIMLLGGTLAFLTPTSFAAEADDAEIEFWRSVKETTVPAELEAYLKAYPDGKFSALARIRLKALETPEQEDATETAAPREADAAPEPADDEDAQTANEPSESTSPAADDTPAIAMRELKATLGAHPNDPTRGFLGVEKLVDTRDLADALGLDTSGGVLVISVVPDTAGEKAGFKPGHVVTAIDGTKTPDDAAFMDLMQEFAPGREVSFTVAEGGSTPAAVEDFYSRKSEHPAAAYALSTFIGDEENSIKLLRKAAEADYQPAVWGMGELHRKGYGSVARDMKEAARWYRKGAELGHSPSAFSMGAMYWQGDGVPKDDAQGFRYYLKAAELGHPIGMFNAGAAYAYGQGVANDDGKAVEWYRKAVEQGNTSAMVNLANMYERGRGVPKDYKQAAKLYRQAMNLGFPPAKNNLSVLYNSGLGVPKDSKEAARLVLEAYAVGDRFATKNLEQQSSKVFSHETRAAIQTFLKNTGFYKGKADGKFGPGTKRALAAFAEMARPPAQNGQPPAKEDDLGLGNLDALD